MRIIIMLLLVISGCNKHANSIITVNGKSLSYKFEKGVKVFHLIAEPVAQEFAPGLKVNIWGYNGGTPGPTIEAVEGDRVRILVTNKLPEATTIHWHGILVPNHMDGVAGLNQAPIEPGKTHSYEFTLKQHGTYMYHPNYDQITQIGMGLMGFFIIHPKIPEDPPIDRDFAIFLMDWFIPPGAATPDPLVTTNLNYATINGRVFPGTEPLVAKKNERVRIRFANLSVDSHPMHLHGYAFTVMAQGGWQLPQTAQYVANTVDVFVGNTNDIEFVANAPGDWALHCTNTHHLINGIGHDISNMLGVDQNEVTTRLQNIFPDYVPIGSIGTGELSDPSRRNLSRPSNFLPYGSAGPLGTIDLGGMTTILKVREELTSYDDPGWYAKAPLSSIRKDESARE